METDETAADESTSPPQSSGRLPFRRSRLGTLGALAVVLVVAVLAALIFTTRDQGGSFAKPPDPTATATLSLQQTQVLFVNPAPWGTLTINGTPADATVATLPPGTSRLIYEAAPFPTLTCYISAPASPNDTCPAGTTSPTAPFTGRVVDLGATLDNLSTKDFIALVAATHRALEASTSTAEVVAGDHYIDASGHIATSAQTLQAALAFVVPTQAVSYQRDRCAPFCVGPGPQPLNGEGLHFVVFPTPQWSFTAPGGAKWSVGEKPVSGNPIDMLVMWSGSWQVTIAAGPMVGSTLEETALATFPPSSAPGGQGGTGGGAVASPIAAGMALPVVGGGARGLVLYHFGVSVAVDAGARQLYPTMPVASAHEAALAAQLVSHT